ncbi:hypothetical protein [Parapedobacter sp. GCM10030251]|uniref:hypothetical protein n=1 Tax=Parapedobacter sp. GCM10030251 TaxID=3273419 RepID=UPI00366DA7A0
MTFLAQNRLYCQSLQPKPVSVAPGSPNVAAMERYGRFDVNLYYGVPNISIDLFEVISKELKIPFKLSYHASGIKVSDIASWVGLGWSLTPMGGVNRRIKGNRDESSFLSPNFQLKKSGEINPYTYNGYDYLRTIFEGNRDASPDIFSYTIPQKFGHFFYRGRDSAAIMVPYSPVRIRKAHDQVYQSELVQFELDDDDGTTYIFGKSIAGEVATESTEYTKGSVSSGGISSWLLTNMVSNDRSDTITFRYNEAVSLVTHNITEDFVEILDQIYQQSGTWNMAPSVHTSERFTNTRISQRLMKEIIFKNGKAEFVLSAGNRDDLEAKSLNRILLYSKVAGQYKLIKAIQFYYSYFTGYNTSRLKLDSLAIQAPDNSISQMYKFTYHSTTGFPDVNSKHKDYWGYFNNKANTTLIPKMTVPYGTAYPGTEITIGGLIGGRDPDSNYVKMGVLNKIEYPTGGYTLFEYEPNRYLEGGTTARIGGGIRIKTITSYPSTSAVPEIKTYQYGNADGTENGFGQLNSISSLQYSPYTTQVEVWDTPTTLPLPVGRYRYRRFSAEPVLDINDFDEANVRYPYVVEYRGTVENNSGKTTYLFSNVSDNIITVFMPVSPQVETQHWERGHLKQKREFARIPGSQYKKVYQLDNYYDVVNPATHTDVGILIGETLRREGPHYESVLYQNPLPYLHAFYKVNTGVYKVHELQETTYENDNEIKKEKFLEYNSKSQISTIREMSSKTDTVFRQFKYGSDFNTTTAIGDALGIRKLNQSNVVSIPIEETLGVKPKDGSLKTTAGKITTFENNRPLPKDEYYLEIDTPIDGYQGSTVNSSGIFVIPPNYQKRVSYTYQTSPSNNLLQYNLHTERNTHSFLWSYNGQYPIAEVKNAVQADIAYAGFEGDGTGNWIYSSATTPDTTAPTGKRVYVLTGSNNLQKTGLTLTRSYLLTYWAKSTSATGISGGTATVMRSKGGWTQYRRVISGVTSVSLSGSVAVDDVRLHPMEATMNSYTYDPLVGMTSHTDASGNVFQYEYDDFGRLEAVKDLNGHLVEDYRYHYRNQ